MIYMDLPAVLGVDRETLRRGDFICDSWNEFTPDTAMVLLDMVLGAASGPLTAEQIDAAVGDELPGGLRAPAWQWTPVPGTGAGDFTALIDPLAAAAHKVFEISVDWREYYSLAD